MNCAEASQEGLSSMELGMPTCTGRAGSRSDNAHKVLFCKCSFRISAAVPFILTEVAVVFLSPSGQMPV
jgi:hypothetical protein